MVNYYSIYVEEKLEDWVLRVMFFCLLRMDLKISVIQRLIVVYW